VKRRKILAWSAYAVAVAAMFEGMARLALSNEGMRERLFTNDDASWRLQWVARQGRQGGLSYSIDDWNPTRGWTLKPGLRDVPFRGDQVNSNAQGFRGTRDTTLAKAAGVTRILVLGDSFTFGEEVGDEDTYARQLESLLPETEVLNLGVHGYGHDQMLLYLREVGLRYQPDVVLLGFLPDDMERNVLSFRDFAKPRFAVEDGALARTNGDVPTPAAVLSAEKWRSSFADLMTMARSRYEWRTGRTQKQTRELTWRLLEEIDRDAKNAGAKVAFAYLPVYGEIPRKETNLTWREKEFFDGCRTRGIDAIHLQPAFREKAIAGAEFKVQGHWGPLEHRTAAEAMAAFLRAKGWVD
jgi:hypothetical protein